MKIDASGRFAFGAGEGSGKLAVFQIDQNTGKLSRLHTQDVGNLQQNSCSLAKLRNQTNLLATRKIWLQFLTAGKSEERLSG